MDILEILIPVSEIFEVEGLITCKVEIVIAETMQNTEEEIDTCGKDDEFLTSHLASFKRIGKKKKKKKKIFCPTFIKADDTQKKTLHKEIVSIELNVAYSDTNRNNASTNKSNLLLKRKQILSERFDDQKGLA